MDKLTETIIKFHLWLNISNPQTVQEVKDYWEKLREEYFDNLEIEQDLLGKTLYYDGD